MDRYIEGVDVGDVVQPVRYSEATAYQKPNVVAAIPTAPSISTRGSSDTTIPRGLDPE
jgi:hypothetical protein